MIRPDQEIAARLGTHEILVLVQQVFHCGIVMLLGLCHDFLVAEPGKTGGIFPRIFFLRLVKTGIVVRLFLTGFFPFRKGGIQLFVIKAAVFVRFSQAVQFFPFVCHGSSPPVPVFGAECLFWQSCSGKRSVSAAAE